MRSHLQHPYQSITSRRRLHSYRRKRRFPTIEQSQSRLIKIESLSSWWQTNSHFSILNYRSQKFDWLVIEPHQL